MTSSLMKQQQPGAIAAPVWTQEQRDLIRKTICPPNTTDLEFEFFVTWCAQTGLNPMLKQAWLVPRKQKNPSNGRYEEKMEPQVAEIGMRARADEMPDYRGISGDAVYEGDEFMVDAEAGTVVHKYSLTARKAAGNKLLGAWARVRRENREPSLAFLPLESRIQTYWDNDKKQHVVTAFWAKDPAGQISKCARAHVLRLAYPNVFAGQYIEGEAPREEIEVNDPPAPAGASASEELEARLRGKLKVVPVKYEVLPKEKPLASDTTIPWEDPKEQSKKAEAAVADAIKSVESNGLGHTRERQEPKKEEAKPKPAKKDEPKDAAKKSDLPITHLRFGKAAGTLLADCSTIELEEAIDVAKRGIASLGNEKPRWLDSTLEGIKAAQAEIARRAQADSDDSDVPREEPSPPEPGSEASLFGGSPP